MDTAGEGFTFCSKLVRHIFLGAWLATPCALPGATMFLGPSPYLSSADLPFTTNGFAYFVLEDLESGSVSLPGALVNTGWAVLLPGPLTDSVDGDDGMIWGAGTNGHSAFSALSQSNLTITFDPGVLGAMMPTHAGIVCTDIGAVFSGALGFADVTFTAYDTNGVLLGSITATNFGNGSAFGSGPGATAEDRFFGVIHAPGLGRICLSVTNTVDWEVDHLQYGHLDFPDAPPRLRIEVVNPGNVRLAWATNAGQYELQRSVGLPGTNWTPVSGIPVVLGEDYQVTITPSESNRFYRLISAGSGVGPQRGRRRPPFSFPPGAPIRGD